MSSNTLVSYFTSTCGGMSTQIAAMTTLHIPPNVNYLRTHAIFPVVSVDALALRRYQSLIWAHPKALAICPALHVRQSVECQLIRLFSSRAGSNFPALQRSGSMQHCLQTLDGAQVSQCGQENQRWKSEHFTLNTKYQHNNVQYSIFPFWWNIWALNYYSKEGYDGKCLWGSPAKKIENRGFNL